MNVSGGGGVFVVRGGDEVGELIRRQVCDIEGIAFRRIQFCIWFRNTFGLASLGKTFSKYKPRPLHDS